MKTGKHGKFMALVMAAMLAVCACVPAVAAGAGETLGAPEAPLELMDVLPEAALPEANPALHRVAFFDLHGEPLGWVDVPDGLFLVIEVDNNPVVEGLVFDFWYDATLEEPEAFDFTQPVHQSINLVPYYLIAEGNPEYKQEESFVVMDDTQIHNVIGQILGSGEGEGYELPEIPSLEVGVSAQPTYPVYDDVKSQLDEAAKNPDTWLDGSTMAPVTEEELVSHIAVGILESNELPLAGTDDLAEMPGDEVTPPPEFILDMDALSLLESVEGQEEAPEQAMTGETPEQGQQAGEDNVEPAANSILDTTNMTEVEEPLDSRVDVSVYYEGERISEGTSITLTAELINFPEGVAVSYQWQNNINGVFEDVPGATGKSYTFAADALNTSCSWQVRTQYWVNNQ